MTSQIARYSRPAVSKVQPNSESDGMPVMPVWLAEEFEIAEDKIDG